MSARQFAHEPINFGRMSPGVKNIILANIAVFVFSTLGGNSFYEHFGLVPRLVVEQRWLWQPLTYLFVHGGFFHIFFNVFMLWMFGMPVEAQWGTREFIKFYFICGLGVAAVTIAIGPHSSVPLIGASGAIYGLLVAFAMIYPDSVVYLYFLIPIKAAHMALLCGLVEFFAMTTDGNQGVARFAHLAGMVVGYIYIRWWSELELRARAALSGLSVVSGYKDSRSAPRRRESGPRRDDPVAMEEIDRILDKILASGMESLTNEEREIMRRYSNRMKH